jgi:hypothetical protein
MIRSLVSLVCPVYCEESCLEEFYAGARSVGAGD